MNFACPSCREVGSTYHADVPCVKRSCCKVCAEIDGLMVANAFDDFAVRRLTKLLWRHIDEFHKRISKSHSGNGAPVGPFAFTLTKAPTDDLTVDDLLRAVRKLMSQKSCPVKKYAWFLEYGNNETKEHPHIHGMYETEKGGRIERKVFKRCWPIWDESQKLGRGHRGGYHDVARNEGGYSSYIKEDFALNGVGESYGMDA